MSKLLEATCSPAGIVTADGVPVEGAVILSQGKAQSSGILLIDGEKLWYLTSSASDLKTTIEKVASALNQAATGLNSAGGALNGLAGGSGAGAIAAAAAITPIVAELNALKEALK